MKNFKTIKSSCFLYKKRTIDDMKQKCNDLNYPNNCTARSKEASNLNPPLHHRIKNVNNDTGSKQTKSSGVPCAK
jgi:hypothetical protein